MQKVLIVGDDAFQIREYESQLQQDGYTIVIARTNTEGLAFAISGHPNIIVVRMSTFTSDEMEMLSWIRWDTWGKQVPIILITSRDMTDDVVKKLLEYQPILFLLPEVAEPKHISQKITDMLHVSA